MAKNLFSVKSKITALVLSVLLLIGTVPIQVSAAQTSSNVVLRNGMNEDADIKFVELGNTDKQLAVMLMDYGNGPKYFRQLFYSISNGTTVSVPRSIKDDDTTDLQPFVYSQSESPSKNDIIITWTDTDKEFDSNTTAEEIAGSMRIGIAVMNSESHEMPFGAYNISVGKGENENATESNNVCYYKSRVTKLGDKILITWAVCKNVENNNGFFSIEGMYYNPTDGTISTDTNNAIETLNAVDYIRNTLGVNTVLGVSNISFGLPNREAVNTAFYTLAMSRGLSAGIINPNSRPMMNAFYSYKALAGKDESCQEYIKSAVDTEIVQKTENLDLKTAIIKGMKEESARCAKELLENTESLVIINDYIIPALDVVGDGFEKNTIFLPQLLMSADSAKAAFDEIKAHFVMSGAEQVKGEKIIIATVEGDIHDIGKNIVKVLLQNYGFDVMDLGKDVKCEKVLEEAQKNNVKLVGLSALMTTTVPNMEKTIKLLHDNTDAKVFVGGAVLTRDYAEMINADFYAKDAMESVRIAQEFFEE